MNIKFNKIETNLGSVIVIKNNDILNNYAQYIWEEDKKEWIAITMTGGKFPFKLNQKEMMTAKLSNTLNEFYIKT